MYHCDKVTTRVYTVGSKLLEIPITTQSMQQHPNTMELALYNYLTKERLLSDKVIDEASFHMAYSGDYIAIPVKDSSGDVVFNKYRKFNSKNTGPKYRYETGSKNTLYGLDVLSTDPGVVFLCEGEFDSLIIRSQLNMEAASLTGGSSSFSDDLIEPLRNKTVVICYDYDAAGIVGAFKMSRALNTYNIENRFLWLEKEKMDVTDFIREFGAGAFVGLINPKEKDLIPYENGATLPVPAKELTLDSSSKKKDINDAIKLANATLENLLGMERMLSSKRRLYTHVSALKSFWKKRKQDYKILLEFKKHGPRKSGLGDITSGMVFRAKKVPVERFVKFDGQNKATSLWKTDDKTPSMHLYRDQNRVHCFAAGRGGDVIDVVMALHPDLNFVDAVKHVLQYE